jgi:hypothetical protein
MFLGDLNVLEPNHEPHYPFFAPFEYDFYRQLTHDSALSLRLAVDPGETLITSDPAAASEPPTLF